MLYVRFGLHEAETNIFEFVILLYCFNWNINSVIIQLVSTVSHLFKSPSKISKSEYDREPVGVLEDCGV